MRRVYVAAAGVAAPGLADWNQARPVLRGESPYRPQALPASRLSLLPRNEARRAGSAVRFALRAAEQVCAHIDARRYATVFASANGDTDISDRICTALCAESREVSPTQFHNSVHNAAAGYWSIATGAQHPANSIAAGADSFAVALQEAWAMLSLEQQPVLLVGFETAGGGKLAAARPPVIDDFACALALSPEADAALASLEPPRITTAAATRMDDPGLERLRQYNPAARSLALLASIAADSSSECVLESSQGNLAVSIGLRP